MRCLLALLAATTLVAADPPPEIPDPIGLGPHLALLDFLRDQWRLKPPDGASYETLCAIYWAERRRRESAARTELPDLNDGAPDEAALARDRLRRLADELRRRHGIEPPKQADEAELTRLLREARSRREAAALDATRQSAPRGRPQAPEPSAQTSASRPAAAPAPEPADPTARWKARLAALWAAREEQCPSGAALGWTAEQPPLAEVSNPFRWRQAGGEYQYGNTGSEFPEPAPGLEVWLNVTRIEPSALNGFSQFQTSRWRPAWWSPADRRWISEPPAKAGWIRDSQANQALMSLLLAGPAGNRAREELWRKSHETTQRDKLEDGGQLGGDLVAMFVAVQLEYKATLPLEQLERTTHTIERRWPLVARFEQTLIAAQNQEGGNATAAPVQDSLRQLQELGEWMQERHQERRQHWLTTLEALGIRR